MICLAAPGTVAVYRDDEGNETRRPVLVWREMWRESGHMEVRGLVARDQEKFAWDSLIVARDVSGFIGYELPPATIQPDSTVGSPPIPAAERHFCDYEDCAERPVWIHVNGERFCEEHCKVLLEERIADLRGKLAQAELELREARAENEELRAKLEIAYMPRVGDCVRLVSSPDEQDALVIGHVGTIVEIDPNSVMFRYILDLKGTPGSAGIHADAVFELVDSIAREAD